MPPIPKILLQEVYWSFSESTPPTPGAFVEAAGQYAADIDCPNPAGVLSEELPFSDVKLRYAHWVRGESGEWEEREEQIRVTGQDGRLTGADLLWELHVACATTVGTKDHHFFEGLELQDAGGGSDPPLYEVVLGS